MVDNLLPLFEAGTNVNAWQLGEGLVVDFKLHVDPEQQGILVHLGEAAGTVDGFEAELGAEGLVCVGEPGLLDYAFDILATL